MNYYNELLRACCSSTGKWYLRWDLRSALSSSSSSCCRIRSYPWHSSRGIVADGDGAPAWPPHNTAPAPPGLASATACHTPKIQTQFHSIQPCTVSTHFSRFTLHFFAIYFFLSRLLLLFFLRKLATLLASDRRPRRKTHPSDRRPQPSYGRD